MNDLKFVGTGVLDGPKTNNTNNKRVEPEAQPFIIVLFDSYQQTP